LEKGWCGANCGLCRRRSLFRISKLACYLFSPAWSHVVAPMQWHLQIAVHRSPIEYLLEPFQVALVCSCIACWIEVHASLVDECATWQLNLIEPQKSNACENVCCMACQLQHLKNDMLVVSIIVIVMPTAPCRAPRKACFHAHWHTKVAGPVPD
jgi:hypothetical protein